MAANAPAPISYGRQLGMLAETHPERAAIIFVPHEGDERRISWRDLDRASNRLARLMAARGVDEHSTVVVGLPNCPEHFIACFATWKRGALALSLRAALPDRERDALLDLAQPALVIADWEGVAFPTLRHVELGADAYDDAPLPDRISDPGRALASGGSTGRPKIIISPGPLVAVPGAPNPLLAALGFRLGQTQLVCAPLYHSFPFVTSYWGLFDDHTLVVMERFDTARAVALIEHHRVEAMYLPPILMQRIAALPDVRLRDFSSLEAVASAGAPCPPWLKRFWIDLVGARQVTEFYGASEGVGAAIIRGDEWLTHPGSVGRPFSAAELRILDDAGRDLPPREVGEIFMRRNSPIGETYRYLGAPPLKVTPDGFASVGDLGWVDDDGYLYIADRRVDMIVTGAANVYPAEVEAALTEHPAVADVAVIGVPDAEWGRRVHAVVELRAGVDAPAASALDRHCRERLASYKAPKTYEFVAALPRNDAGKIRRSALATARESGWTTGMVAAKAGE